MRKRFLPKVGDTVLYYAYGTPGGEFPAGVERAAIITEVDDPSLTTSPVGLCVLNPTGLFFNRHCPFTGSDKQPGGWAWGTLQT